MIGLSWNLPGSIDYSPPAVLDVELTVENLSDVCELHCGCNSDIGETVIERR